MPRDDVRPALRVPALPRRLACADGRRVDGDDGRAVAVVEDDDPGREGSRHGIEGDLSLEDLCMGGL